MVGEQLEQRLSLVPDEVDSAASRKRCGFYTMGSAHVGFMEEKIGSLEAGKLADLAQSASADDYLTVSDEALLPHPVSR